MELMRRADLTGRKKAVKNKLSQPRATVLDNIMFNDNKTECRLVQRLLPGPLEEAAIFQQAEELIMTHRRSGHLLDMLGLCKDTNKDTLQVESAPCCDAMNRKQQA